MEDILKHFILEPNREFHVRELANLVKRSPTTVSKYLVKFEGEGMLKSSKKYNHLLYSANITSPYFRHAKLVFNLKILTSSGLINFLSDEYSYPEAIVLFGSFAKSENVPESDVDLLVITPRKREVDLGSFEKKIGHSIQLFALSRKDIDRMKSKNKELLNNMMNGIVIEGFWEVFR
jgi:predicted nucleotidyltransferase